MLTHLLQMFVKLQQLKIYSLNVAYAYFKTVSRWQKKRKKKKTENIITFLRSTAYERRPRLQNCGRWQVEKTPKMGHNNAGSTSAGFV